MKYRLTSFRLSALCILITACSDTETNSLQQIRAVLDAQVARWNAGDIEGFMQGYAKTDSIRFASGGKVSYGWQKMLERYRKGYPDRAAMGILMFTDIDIRYIDKDNALVFGTWKLKREEDEPWGLFTLHVKRLPEGWRIVHDHTSSGN